MTQALPSLIVECAFAGAPFDAAPTFTAFSTAKVTKLSTQMGRQQALNAFQAGTCSLTFSDPNRELDPLNSSGPHYGQLLPNKRVRVKAVDPLGVTRTVFDGYVNGWPIQYDDNFTTYVTLQLTDAFKLLSRYTLPDCPLVPVIAADAPSGWWRFGETSGLVAHDSSGNGYDGTYYIDQSRSMSGPGIVSGTNQGSLAIGNAEASNVAAGIVVASIPSGAGVSGSSWSVEFFYKGYMDPTVTLGMRPWTQADGVNSTCYISLIPYDVSTLQVVFSAGKVVGDLAWNGYLANDNRLHHVVFSRTGSTLQVIEDGVDVTFKGTTGGTLGTPSALASNVQYYGNLTTSSPSLAMSDLAIYPSAALTLSQAQAHYAAATSPRYGDSTGARINYILGLVGWPGARATIDNGLSTLGNAKWNANTKALAYLQTVEATEQGELFFDQVNDQIRFADRQTLLSGAAGVTSNATFTDNPATSDASALRPVKIGIIYNDQLLYNRSTVTYDGGSLTVDDSASQATYGIQSTSQTTIHRAATYAKSLGQWVINRYRNPIVRVQSIDFDLPTLSLLWAQGLGRNIGDRVTVRFNPRAVGSVTTTDLLIEGVSHSADWHAGTWRTTFWMRPPDVGTGAPIAAYWTLGTTTFTPGTSPVLAP